VKETTMNEPAIARFEKESDVVLVHVQTARLDESSTRRLEAATQEAAEATPSLPFVVDLARVEFLSSLSLAALVRLALNFRDRGQRLILAALQPNVREVFEVTRLARMMEIREDVSAALAAIRAPEEPNSESAA
jgi:anti-anti-sigma factor